MAQSYVPPCVPPEALRNAEQQESSTPEQIGPAVHPPHNNTTTYPTIAVAPDIRTYEHLHIQVHREQMHNPIQIKPHHSYCLAVNELNSISQKETEIH